MALLEVEQLTVEIATPRGPARILDGVDFALDQGESLGLVGESGCGKSMTALAIMGLLPEAARARGRILFEGRDLLSADEATLCRLRGGRIAMVFQEPMTALNPVFPVGDQIAEVLVTHRGMAPGEAAERAVDLLAQVGIAAPAQRAHDYPHNLSGGMRQRVMIAMALACSPALLIADEPTTALDVTVQAQIVDLLLRLQDEVGMAIQFISHSLGVISEIADEVVVMYAGRIVERAPADELFRSALHPYTRGLLETVPRIGARLSRLPAIPGAVPSPAHRPTGCAFRNRCPWAEARCAEAQPALETLAPGHQAACFVAAGDGR